MSDAPRPKNVIWIVVDTLRADHLGCYGYQRNTSPNIDSFARNAIKFDYNFSACSYTGPSHASMFTSKYPSSHSTGFYNMNPVAPIDSDIFLAEVMSSQGYETAAFVSAVVLLKERQPGISSGFMHYDDRTTSAELNRPDELIRPAPDTNKAIFEWLGANSGRDFFMFINYFDVHGPYLNPDAYEKVFVGDEFYGEPRIIEKIVPDQDPVGGIPEYQVLKPERDETGKIINCEKDERYYLAQYDGGIRYLDLHLQGLFDELKKLGIYDDSLIVITSDHGEAMGENGVWFFHGLTLTKDQIHVPLIIKPHSGWDVAPKAIDCQVSSVDIMPTVLELAGVDYDGMGLQGRSLIKLASEGVDQELSDRTVMAELEGQRAFIDKDSIHIIPKEVNRDKLVSFYSEEMCAKERLSGYRGEDNQTVISPTGERFLPWVMEKDIEGYYERLHRYAFARQYVQGKTVLEIPCGEGYGADILAGAAEHVVAVDKDGIFIRHARKKYARGNLEFIAGGMEDIPAGAKFDAIVSFDGLSGQEKLLSVLRERLNEGGILLTYCPDKSRGQLERTLKANFRQSAFFGQDIRAGSHIWPMMQGDGSQNGFTVEKAADRFSFCEMEGKAGGFCIAIASDQPVRVVSDSFLADRSDSLLGLKDSLIDDKDRVIDRLKAELDKKNEELAARVCPLKKFERSFRRNFVYPVRGLFGKGSN